MKLRALLAALIMLTAASALAATRPHLSVEGVQMPAWVERSSGAREPLAIGMALGNQDRIYTGPGSRALLRLADGSVIKLGENGVLALDDLDHKRDGLKSLVTASLDVVSGAFRFTTQALYKYRGQRDIKVRISTLTAGIRGTDVWGKPESTRDIVCLIEGKITVARGQDAVTMDQPLSFYIAPKNAPPLPVAPVSREQLERWAQETEIPAGTGAMRKGGKWQVVLAQAPTEEQARSMRDELRMAGYAAEIRATKPATGDAYQILIPNLPNRRNAAAVGAKLKGSMGVVNPKVSM